ncbi:hypothetical protein QWI17_09225 [Gilvimarinus sp. SDUM040013]|uniref:Adenosine deaminase domain-containing protein n=1 Tax=Gilvimarinus gilvus TaxID=3058038 RepID=A0ABU4RZZ2_9GAMM|nr:hypothetical protein [Gilvimarinus sp. SDUM040013]MDO3386016.1 hypothetical protein [Gilvimarinus sp. SDUM040013]MDX6850470.1 hypothetical protein [Gilvimarinus sp. SDUM040013]
MIGNPFVRCKKAEYHAHGILSASRSDIFKINPGVLEVKSRFLGWDEFEDSVRNLLSSAWCVSNYCYYIKSAISNLVLDNVCYAELSFDLSDHLTLGIEFDCWLELIFRECQSHGESILIKPEIGLNARHGSEFYRPWFVAACESGVFHSVDLYGNVNIDRALEFKSFFTFAERSNLKKKAHLGEFNDCGSSLEFLKFVALDEIQHGVSILNSPVGFSILSKKRIPLNLSLSSNIALGVVYSFESYPFRRMLDKDLSFRLSTDDYLVFGRSISDDAMAVCQLGLLSQLEMEAVLSKGVPLIP